MKNKMQYYQLDEIGFVGTQEKISVIQQKMDAIRTSEIINNEKSQIKISGKRVISTKNKIRGKAIM